MERREKMSGTNKDTPHYTALDDAITTYLRRHEMTQAELADELGMSENSLSWKRRGIRDWNVSEAVKVCNIVGITLDEAVAVPTA